MNAGAKVKLNSEYAIPVTVFFKTNAQKIKSIAWIEIIKRIAAFC
jgi:hypothetical protein